MKKSWLTAKELATLLQVSLKTVRRAYRNGEIPMVRFRHMVRFDLEQVRRVVQQEAVRPSLRVVASREQGAIAGASRRRATTKSPRSVKRGRNFHGS
ncbi:MAG TPA: helix-turn-helix domain-containing protein [Nitrospiraceae bacterium]|nr:helix-turn-helix domain-containing protein [Nitrospiraceae bacterium]